MRTPAPGLLPLRRSQAKEHTTKWLCNGVQRRGNLTEVPLSGTRKVSEEDPSSSSYLRTSSSLRCNYLSCT